MCITLSYLTRRYVCDRIGLSRSFANSLPLPTGSQAVGLSIYSVLSTRRLEKLMDSKWVSDTIILLIIAGIILAIICGIIGWALGRATGGG